MKTTIKLGLCAAALLLVLAGCNNAVKPTEVNDSMVKAAVNAGNMNMSGTNAFKVDSIDAGTAYGDDIVKYVVKVTFTHPVTKDSLHNGVTFHKLSDATETYTMPKFESTYNTDVRVVENEVYFTLPHKAADLKDVYIFVDATKVEAANGAKLNQDTDTVWGESGDDDYAKYISPAGTSALTKGNVDFNKQCATLNKTLPDDLGLTISYTYGSNAEARLVKKIEITSNASLQALFDSSEWTEDGKIAAVTGIIKDHLKFEQYNWEKKEWEPLSPSFKRDSGKWVSDVTVAPDRTIRYKWIDTDKISLSSKLYGYALRWSLKADAARTVVQAPSSSGYETTGSVSLSENSLWPSTDLTIKKDTAGRVEITFDPWHLDTYYPSYVPAHYTSFDLWADNTWYSVTPKNKETGKCSLFAGFATDTLIKDNFKCFEGTGVNAKELAIKGISYASSNVAAYPHANNKVVILFNDVTKTADNVYISPKVRTAVFSGSYAKGSERVPCEIKSLSFANIAPTTDPYKLGGWIKK